MRRNSLLAKITLAVVVTVFAFLATGASALERTLVVDTSFVLVTNDPGRTIENTGYLTERAQYDTLLTASGPNWSEPRPSLASSYTVNDDNTEFTFKLRRDVKFSDGTPLTSADVVFSLRRIVNLQANPSYVVKKVIAIDAPDAYTVVVRTKSPDPALPIILTNPATGILNSKVVKENGGTDAENANETDTAESYLNANSAGSGPYILESWNRVGPITLKANPNYWGAEPVFQTIVVRNQQAATALISIQKAGTYEFALNLSVDQAASIKSEKLNITSRPAAVTFFLYSNDNPEVSTVSSNPHIQQAVRYGVDYQALLQIAGEGAVQAPGIVPSMFLGALPASNVVQRDVARAKQEVAASGISNPTIILDYVSDTSQNGLSFGTVAQSIQSSLADVGITVELRGRPSLINKTSYHGGTQAMAVRAWSPDYAHPIGYTVFGAGQRVGLRAGWAEGANPAVEALVSEIATAPSSALDELFQEFQNEMSKRSPFFPLMQPSQVLVGTRTLTNLEYNPQGFVDVTQLGVTE